MTDERPDLATSPDRVDRVNARFYGRFPFPWRPQAFRQVTDPDFELAMLSQELGEWHASAIPRDSELWVAGCGTNQAVATALRFPRARVVGSDLSEESLAIATATARQLGLTNLELRQESLNQVEYRDRFDFVICTGVIHHNADPAAVLVRLARAMKPDGLLELMVYNRFHRVTTSAFQKAIRLLSDGDGEAAGEAAEEGAGEDRLAGDVASAREGPNDEAEPGRVDFESQLDVTRRIVEGGFASPGLMHAFLRDYKNGDEARTADSLIQPVEWSYTVASLADMAERCGLTVAASCVNAFDAARGTWCWELEFGSPDVQARYDRLPDQRRWEIANLLMLELSPKLWFYLQRRDGARPRRTTREIDQSFTATIFRPVATEERFFRASPSGRYVPSASSPYPPPPADPTLRAVLAAVDGTRPMGEILRALGKGTSGVALRKLRQQLTTPVFPYLRAAPSQT